jgi:hypothetical protein
MKIITFLILFSSATFAQSFMQNIDVGVLFGPAPSSHVTPIGSSSPSGAVGFATETNFSYQLFSIHTGIVYLDVPEAIIGNANIPGEGGSNALFLTPGLRLKIPTGTRVSFYGALGAGFGYFHEVDVMTDGVLLATPAKTYRPAGDFGAGIDFRVACWFSLRGEARDFITAPGLGGAAGHNHPVFLVGFAFHS